MGPERASSVWGRRQEAAGRSRRRRCLLKGCDRWFVPRHPLARYCGPECRRKAAEWRRWKARRRYRSSEGGRKRRREQSRRRRRRLKERRGLEAQQRQRGLAPPEHHHEHPLTAPERSVGHHDSCPAGLFSCDRPGCYELFCRSVRSPLQHFCCSGCRRALRRVLLRERRHLKGAAASAEPQVEPGRCCVTHIDPGRRLSLSSSPRRSPGETTCPAKE